MTLHHRSSLSARGLITLLLLSACQTPTTAVDPWATIAEHDPLFGGGLMLESRVLKSPRHTISGDESKRRAFFDQIQLVNDRAATTQSREALNEDLARSVASFVESDAGRAYLRAELLVLTGYPHHGEEFPQQTASRYSKRESVGQSAREIFLNLQASMQEGTAGSVSPVQLSYLVGAMTISEAQADGIRAFLGSDAGQRWTVARSSVMEETRKRFFSFRDAAISGGFLEPREGVPDLTGYLPRVKQAPRER